MIGSLVLRAAVEKCRPQIFIMWVLFSRQIWTHRWLLQYCRDALVRWAEQSSHISRCKYSIAPVLTDRDLSVLAAANHRLRLFPSRILDGCLPTVDRLLKKWIHSKRRWHPTSLSCPSTLLCIVSSSIYGDECHSSASTHCDHHHFTLCNYLPIARLTIGWSWVSLALLIDRHLRDRCGYDTAGNPMFADTQRVSWGDDIRSEIGSADVISF